MKNVCFRVELTLNAVQFIEPQQQFTIRQDPVTVGTGVFTKLHSPRTEAEKDKKILRKLMKVLFAFYWTHTSAGFFFRQNRGNMIRSLSVNCIKKKKFDF